MGDNVSLKRKCKIGEEQIETKSPVSVKGLAKPDQANNELGERGSLPFNNENRNNIDQLKTLRTNRQVPKE